MKRLLAALGVLALVAIAALAQDVTGRSDNGFFINLLENRLSTPSRQIRLSGVSGALSSRARVAQITISDTQGPWLQIDNAEVDWNRLALLRGRVDVNRLTAQSVTWMRPSVQPPPARDLPRVEVQPFALPELPVSIRLHDLALERIRFEEPVFGQAAELTATGSLELASGALDTAIDVTRLDPPGGDLTLKAAFSNATRQLDLDLALQEPKGGVVATLLNIEGSPAIDLRLQGSGPLDQVDVNFSLDADSDRIAQGVVALRSSDEGLGFTADFGGSLSQLVPAEFRDFFAGPSTIKLQGVKKAAGGLRIDTLDVSGAVLQLNGDLETGPDSFLRNLTLMGTLGDPRGPAVVLPVPGGRTRIHSGVLHVNYGDASRWDGLLVLDRLQTADIEMEDVTFRLGGLAQNLEDPATRRVTINVEGLATGLWAPKPEIARALGTRIDLFADAALNPGGPIDLNQLQVSGNGLSIFSAGSIEDLHLHRPQRHTRRGPRDLLRTRQPRARRRHQPAHQRQRQPAQRRVRPHLRRQHHRPRAWRRAPRRAGGRRDHALRPGRARRRRHPHRQPAPRQRPALLRLERADFERQDRHRLRGHPQRPLASRPAGAGQADRLRPCDGRGLPHRSHAVGIRPGGGADGPPPDRRRGRLCRPGGRRRRRHRRALRQRRARRARDRSSRAISRWRARGARSPGSRSSSDPTA